MIFPDLASPAEAGALREGGKPIAISDQVEDKLFGIMR